MLRLWLCPPQDESWADRKEVSRKAAGIGARISSEIGYMGASLIYQLPPLITVRFVLVDRIFFN